MASLTTKNEMDPEKGAPYSTGSVQEVPVEGEIRLRNRKYADEEKDVVAAQGLFKNWLKRVEQMNIEGRGIERVRPEDREPQSVWDGFTIWAAANFTASTFATGCLGPIFGLGFWDSFSIIIIVNFFTSWLVGLFGTFGPHTGLRQIIMTRYSFGIWGSRLIVILNVCGMMGWAAVNSIAGAQVLHAVSDGKCPLWAGNLIICVIASVICLWGYHIIHKYEHYSWIPQVVVFCFLAGYGARFFDASKAPMGSGTAEAAGCMSFIATIYGFTAGWAGNAVRPFISIPTYLIIR